MLRSGMVIAVSSAARGGTGGTRLAVGSKNLRWMQRLALVRIREGDRVSGACEPEPEIDLVRLIVAELERIYNHLADLAASASGAGYAVGFVRGWR